MRTKTDFDQGYLSRIIARLEEAGVIRKKAVQADGRAQELFLTAKGKTVFSELNQRANEQAATLLKGMGHAGTSSLPQSVRHRPSSIPRPRQPSFDCVRNGSAT